SGRGRGHRHGAQLTAVAGSAPLGTLHAGVMRRPATLATGVASWGKVAPSDLAHLRRQGQWIMYCNLQTAMLTNRRRSIRILADLPVRWKRGRQLVSARIVEINEDGLFFETAEHIAPSQLFEITIDLPSGPVSVSAVSRVCGPTKRGTGIGAQIFA